MIAAVFKLARANANCWHQSLHFAAYQLPNELNAAVEAALLEPHISRNPLATLCLFDNGQVVVYAYTVHDKTPQVIFVSPVGAYELGNLCDTIPLVATKGLPSDDDFIPESTAHDYDYGDDEDWQDRNYLDD